MYLSLSVFYMYMYASTCTHTLYMYMYMYISFVSFALCQIVFTQAITHTVYTCLHVHVHFCTCTCTCTLLFLSFKIFCLAWSLKQLHVHVHIHVHVHVQLYVHVHVHYNVSLILTATFIVLSFTHSNNEDSFRSRSTTYSGPSSSGGSSPSFRRVPSPMATRNPLRANEGQLTLSPVSSAVEVSLPDTIQDNEAEGSDDEIADLSPTLARSHQHLFSSRRNSFLYQSDNEDSPSLAVASNAMSRASSVSR